MPQHPHFGDSVPLHVLAYPRFGLAVGDRLVLADVEDGEPHSALVGHGLHVRLERVLRFRRVHGLDFDARGQVGAAYGRFSLCVLALQVHLVFPELGLVAQCRQLLCGSPLSGVYPPSLYLVAPHRIVRERYALMLAAGVPRRVAQLYLGCDAVVEVGGVSLPLLVAVAPHERFAFALRHCVPVGGDAVAASERGQAVVIPLVHPVRVVSLDRSHPVEAGNDSAVAVRVRVLGRLLGLGVEAERREHEAEPARLASGNAGVPRLRRVFARVVGDAPVGGAPDLLVDPRDAPRDEHLGGALDDLADEIPHRAERGVRISHGLGDRPILPGEALRRPDRVIVFGCPGGGARVGVVPEHHLDRLVGPLAESGDIATAAALPARQQGLERRPHLRLGVCRQRVHLIGQLVQQASRHRRHSRPPSARTAMR